MEKKEAVIIKILKAPLRFILPYKLRLWIYILREPSRKITHYWDMVTDRARKNIADFMEYIFNRNVVKSPVLEIGAGPYKPPYKFNKELFSRRYKYISSDTRYYSTLNVICGGENLPFLSSSLGTIICNEVLEHVPEYMKAVKEIHRVLIDNGVLILTVPFGYHFHDNPNDYWRFTTYGIKYILNPYFKDINIKTYSYIKDDEFPLNICLTAIKRERQAFNAR